MINKHGSKKMKSTHIIITLISILVSSIIFASDESIISGFIDKAVTPLDKLVMEKDDYSTTTISVISYDIVKTNSLIFPYTGLIVFGGVRKYCFTKENSEELSCETKPASSQNRTIYFQSHYKSGWTPVKASFRNKETLIDELIQTDKTNPLTIYLASFFKGK